MKRMKNIRLGTLVACMCVLWGCEKPNVNIVMPQEASNRVLFAGEHLKKALEDAGYSSVMLSDTAGMDKDEVCIRLEQAADTAGLKKEGFTISTRGNMTTVTGNDGSGVIYGCRELIDHVGQYKDLKFPAQLTDAPEMVLRGGCVGIQKMEYLPGRGVYEYPYTPESFPWFYDKEQWIKYLDMLVENRMNSLYLWNGHPFASLVKLEEYPFAVEVDEETFKKNEEMFSFLTAEADKRGIFVIQMFYNILLSKPFAEHYGLKTQDRNRPITPLIGDYTRKSVAAFIEKYPNVGLLVCLGEAMDTYEDDVEWFTKTIIPGVKDGLKALGRTDEPPILLRAHDTDCKMVMDAALPLYKNLYTMHKYNGESLTTYEPRGPWSKIHSDLSALGSIHISNVHILANLEPWRWGSPDFVQKAVNAMHNVHGAMPCICIRRLLIGTGRTRLISCRMANGSISWTVTGYGTRRGDAMHGTVIGTVHPKWNIGTNSWAIFMVRLLPKPEIFWRHTSRVERLLRSCSVVSASRKGTGRLCCWVCL